MKLTEIISSGILELYATGAASIQEIELVHGYIKKYPEVASELSTIESDLEAYAHLFSVEPNSVIKEKIFDRISSNNTNGSKIVGFEKYSMEGPAKDIRQTPVIRFSIAAAVALLFGSIALNIVQYYKNGESDKKLLQTNEKLASLNQDNHALITDMHVVQNKYSKPVSLHGLEAAPDAAAKIFYMQNSGEVYIDASNLPEAPAGKQYQLWGIVDGKPVDGGMIVTAKSGNRYRIQKMKSFGKAEAFAVTLESEKGNKTPKGPMYVMGTM